MTYDQTKKLMKAMNEIETFSIAYIKLLHNIEHKHENDRSNCLTQYNNWVEEAKKTVFDMVNSD